MCAFYFIPFFSIKKHKWIYVYARTCGGHKSRNLCPWSKLDIELLGFGQASSWGSPNKNPSLTCRILLSSLQPWHVTAWLTIKVNQNKNRDFRSALSQDWNITKCKGMHSFMQKHFCDAAGWWEVNEKALWRVWYWHCVWGYLKHQWCNVRSYVLYISFYMNLLLDCHFSTWLESIFPIFIFHCHLSAPVCLPLTPTFPQTWPLKGTFLARKALGAKRWFALLGLFASQRLARF